VPPPAIQAQSAINEKSEIRSNLLKMPGQSLQLSNAHESATKSEVDANKLAAENTVLRAKLAEAESKIVELSQAKTISPSVITSAIQTGSLPTLERPGTSGKYDFWFARALLLVTLAIILVALIAA